MKKYFQRLALALLICSVLPQPAKGQGGVGNNNPTGIAGEYNGSVTTAGSYDPYTGNGKRMVDDLTVAGSLGAYPLKWTRVLNTRYAGWMGGYGWGLWLRRPDSHFHDPPYEGPDGCVSYPDGRRMEQWTDGEGYFGGGGELGDRIVSAGNDNYDLLMRDGGRVRFQNTNPGAPLLLRFRPTAIIDPYGQTTELTYDSAGRLWRVIEPGGRYLQVNYVSSLPSSRVASVQAYAAPGNLVETVAYTFTPWTFNNFTGSYLTRVQYDDGTAATYTYQANNRYDAVYALIKTCHDPRYAGAMKDIEYEYMGFVGAHQPAVGEVWKEKNATHQAVSEMIYPTSGPPSAWLRRTEKRGDGSTRLFQYSDYGELASYTDFEGHTSSIRYEDPGIGSDHYFKILTDARMHETRIKKELIAGAVLAVTRGSGAPMTYAYTEPNNPYYLSSKTDERGKITYYDRDGAHRIWRIRYPDDGFEIFTYNNFGQVLEHRMTSGGTKVFTYDARGLKRTYTPPATLSDPNPGSHPTVYTYYENEGNRPDRIDRLKSVTDPLGHTTTYDYNKRGQVTRVTHHDLTYTQSGYNDYDGHDDGTLAWTADENHPDAWMPGHESDRTRYVYDEYQRVTSVTNPEDKVTSYNYTPVSNPSLGPLSHTTSSVYRVTSHMGKVTEYDYDANFRRNRMTVAPNTAEAATTTYTYDEVGNQITVTEPNAQLGEAAQGPHSTAVYDDRNRRTSLTDALGHRTQWEYDDAGNMKKETRADLKFRTWDVYDAMNRVKQTTGFLGAQEVTRYDYDYAGNQTKMTDANGGIYQTVYDELNRKTTFSYPPDAYSGLSQSERWRYDIAGNLLWYKNPAFQFKHFDYDERNRQKESYWNTSELGTNRDQSIGDWTITGFDNASRVRTITTYNVRASTFVGYTYDDANHKITEVQRLGFSYTNDRLVETLPDDDGNRRTLTVAGAYSLTYDYTLRQQLFRINAAGVGTYFEYNYDKNGNLKKRQNVWQGGGSTNFSYDIGNRVTMCTQFKSNADPDAFSRTDYNDYDLVNNLKSISREEDQWKGERFEYDEANQLKSASYRVEVGPHDAPQGGPTPGPAETADVAEVPKDSAQEAVAAQEPDPVREPLAGGDGPDSQTGPRTVTYLNDAITRKSMNNNGTVTNYTPNNLNQYTAVTGHNTPVYDTNFNLKGYDGWTFVYDADKRLISVGGNGHSAQFVYDGVGRCVKRTIDGDTTVFTFDEWKPIVEWDSAGTHVAWNLYGPGADEILTRYQYNTGGYVHYHLDAMGNVQFLMSANNLGLEKYTYDAFGKPTITTWDGVPLAVSQVGNRFMFTGREYLYSFGLYDYRHRHYHPSLGRFLQVDPIGFKGDAMNLYRYCGGNPVGRADPMGLTDRSFIGNQYPLDQGIRDDVSEINPKDVISVAAHASPTEMMNTNWDHRNPVKESMRLTASEVVKEVRSVSKYNTKIPIKLYMCRAGDFRQAEREGKICPAQQIANQVPNKIIATAADINPGTGRMFDTPFSKDRRWYEFSANQAPTPLSEKNPDWVKAGPSGSAASATLSGESQRDSRPTYDAHGSTTSAASAWEDSWGFGGWLAADRNHGF